MEEKQQPLNIHQRIREVMRDLDYIQKGDKKVNNQYSYVSHDQVSAAVHPLLVKHGIVILPTIIELRQEGNRTVAQLAIQICNVDNPQDNLLMHMYGYGIDQGDKGPGKAISYAYKYALLKLFCLETGDDPDHDQDAKYEPENKSKEPEYISEDQVQMIEHAIATFIHEKDPKYREKALSNFKISSFDKLLLKDFPRLHKNIQNKIVLIENEQRRNIQTD